MPQVPQIHHPTKLNLDKSKKYLSAEDSPYLLNHDTLSVIGKSTPLPANSPACEMEMPDGDNFSIGTYESILTNESYSWVYNSNGVHFVSRINGNGECQVVYSGQCLALDAKPEHAMMQWRALLQVEKICHNRHGKQLLWVIGDDIFCLDVEASIATNNFTTPFFDRCNSDDCDFIKLCVPETCGCLHAEYVPLLDEDASLTNNLADKAFKFIYRHVYYDNRASEWSSVSSLYYQNIIGGCFEGEQGGERCLKLTIPLGNPMVDKIEIGYSIDNGANWLLSDTVEKYSSYTSSAQYWYEREINAELSLTEDGCSFYYTFCNDKQCETIPSERVRPYNPMPREVQGLMPIKNAIGFYNYKQGTCPIDKIQTDKFTVTPVCVDDECVTEYATVKVRAIIHNVFDHTSEFIFREGGDYGDDDVVADAAYFGAFERTVSEPYFKTFDQQFKGVKRNFTAYIEGTNYHAEMKQWRAFNGFSQNKQVGIIAGFEKINTRAYLAAITTSGFYYYQEAEFKVPKGTRGFLRLDSHTSPIFDPNTSTFIIGTINSINSYVSNSALPTVNTKFEIYFDTCTGDQDLLETFIIEDNGEESDSKAVNGYVRDASGSPIENARLYDGGDGLLAITDHNGFYHATTPSWDAPYTIKVNMETDCSTFGTVKTVTAGIEAGSNVREDILVTNIDYVDNFFAEVTGRVIDCEGNGVSGIPVAISGTKYRVTDGGGYFFAFVRNIPTRDLSVRAIAMDRNGCFSLDCDGNCNPCLSTQIQTAPTCFYQASHEGAPLIAFFDFILNKSQKELNFRGLKKGGRYGFGVIAKGRCGRISSVYALKDTYVNMPKLQQDSNENFCSFAYAGNGIILPEWVDCLEVVRTENLNPYELQWVVDKVERTSDGRIKLTIQSLNDYNTTFNGKTNTIYQYAKGDRVEFITNGDGKIFTTLDNGLLNYNTLSPFNNKDLSTNSDASFFNQLLINDDGKLNDLVAGAKIEIQRNKECTSEPAYFGICVSISVVDGQLVIPEGAFETFDTYRVTRQIGSFAPQFFESSFPSDFYATSVSDTGKAYFVNKYENERRYGRNISINSPTQLNYFGDTIKTFDAPEQGDITAMSVTDGKVILAIGEHDNFLAQSADDLLRVGADGIIRALAPDQIISDAQPKLIGAFGCQYPHIGSIYFGDGYAMYADVNKEAYVKHDYSSAIDVAEGKMKTYFKSKFQYMQTLNATVADDIEKVKFSTGRNKHNGAINLTIKAFIEGAISADAKRLGSPNQTLLYHPLLDDFLTFASYTPECYSNIDIFDGKGCAFITYFHGVPYIHPIIPDKYNEFYGVACDRYASIVINTPTTKVKVPVSLEIEDLMMWYVCDCQTEQSNFRSEIPPIKFKKTENKWNASFLKDINSRGGLFNGNQARSFYIIVTLVRDNVNNNKVAIFEDNKRILYDELDSIITKSIISEQSGNSENL